MPAFADRVKDTTTSTGTGAVTLAGSAPTGYRTFASGLGSATRKVRYEILGTSEWEVGTGTFDGTTGLTRDTVASSSNAGALVSFSSGTKDVFITLAAMDIKAGSIGRSYAMARGLWY
jgi:hypothetical protein